MIKIVLTWSPFLACTCVCINVFCCLSQCLNSLKSGSRSVRGGHGMPNLFAVVTQCPYFHGLAAQRWTRQCVNSVYIRATRWLLWHSDFTQFHFGQKSVPNPAVGVYDAPLDSRSAGRGKLLPIPTPSTPSASRCRRLCRRGSERAHTGAEIFGSWVGPDQLQSASARPV